MNFFMAATLFTSAIGSGIASRIDNGIVLAATLFTSAIDSGIESRIDNGIVLAATMFTSAGKRYWQQHCKGYRSWHWQHN